MPEQKHIFLSKSKYGSGLQCLKYLWYQFNLKNEIPAYDPETLEIFKQGQIVGELAHQLYSEGIKLKRDWNPEKMAARSLEASLQRKPLFEAGFVYKNAYAIADILVPVGKDEWDLIEVKSSTRVKPENIYDTAFQKYTYEGAGLKIKKCYLMYVNNEYVRQGGLDPRQFFHKEDISDQVTELLPGIEKKIEAMLRVIGDKSMPDIKVGPHCEAPYECPLQEVCWKFLPDEDVFTLYRGGKTSFALMERGILQLKDIPADFELSDKQRLQVAAHISKKPYIDKPAIKEFLSELKYPLYFLDFETIAPAIPYYDQTRPYEDIPFQYSLHVVEKKGSLPRHYGYLAPGDIDPRPEILAQLKEKLGRSGSIVAYNSGYEIKCLQLAMRTYPEYEKWVDEMNLRMVDLWVPFRKFFYYHPDQRGGGSLKNVLPAMTGKGYADMEIAGGGAARFEYMRVTFDKKVAESERQRVRAALDRYCEMDTLAMVEVVEALGEISHLK
ncbi:hypothetical protein A3F86_04240 [candidate division WOR-1 bacterium RIFCSPLOWO2_12_FULL_45_9]|uniref:DUF2779 domain-containing protein n=1 Tax=candidate division WOR-1 bacterium RIFCSPLOWO2_12_FULL_45_9 TaxID=1802568 RepID=A0A1F4RPX3_UNCSA|nr:MAG: hypothetical protein A3F86_04240 [candidate division WOR-1 bacterium RIFCSPLOWO2_12_FULL_45_9]